MPAAKKKLKSNDQGKSLEDLASRAAAWSSSQDADKVLAEVRVRVHRAADQIGKISKIDPDLLRKRVTL